jgi:hypothetical protein
LSIFEVFFEWEASETMIRETDRIRAFQALNDLLVTARTMAYEKVAHERIADFLDALEELPTLILRDEDLTDEYLAALEDIVCRFPVAGVALQRILGSVPGKI